MAVALGTFLSLLSNVTDKAPAVANLGNASALNLQNFSNLSSFDNCLELVPQDAILSFSELAQKYGHPAQKYEVTTEDGYILTIFRIPGKKKTFPILLMHGLLDTCDTWIERGNNSLSITLAKDDYDVWLGNIRGNPYSRGHVSIDVESNPAAYWNFTFDEHGYYDLSATIDLVLNETGAKKLNAIGHSQGTTFFYVLCSTRPEYNEKINLFISLAPIAYLHHLPPPLSVLIQISPLIYVIGNALEVYEVFPENSLIIQGLRFICPVPVVGYTTCVFGIIFPVFGFDPPELEPCFLRIFIRHYPTQTSLKNLYHLAQVSRRKKFAPYDNGEIGNQVAYNSSTPPDYDLGKVTMKVVLMVSGNDYLSKLEDVAILRKQLPNVVSYRVVPRSQCNHFDYVLGKTMQNYIYPDIFDSLNKYGNN
ncbi:lipase member J-like [Epargyreus clarus]|uniref:lipase member J-like n=1 Tax=Epargyreus clarus TaxID=520877 RepID=UPI003C305A19